MATKKRAPQEPTDKLLACLTDIQASLQRIEEWLALLAVGRGSPPAAERRPTLLSREAVCQLLGLSPEGLYRRIRRGKFPRPAFGTGERSRWREEDLMGTHGLPKGGR